MKKFLLTLLAVISVATYLPAKEATFDFTNAESILALNPYYNKPSDQDLNADYPLISGDVQIKYDKGTSTASSGGGIIRFYNSKELRTSSNTAVKGQQLIFSAGGANITKIVFTAKTFNFTCSSDNPASFSVSNKTWLANGGEFKDVVFKTSGQIIITKIVVTYEDATTPVDPPVDPSKVTPELEWSAQEASAVLGQAFDAPTLTVGPAEYKEDLEALVEYTSSDPAVATIDGNGVVKTLAKGSTVITAAIEAYENYNGASASYTLTVTDIPTSLKWSTDNVTVTLGDAFEAPTLTADPEEILLSTVYSSSNPDVATIDSEGKVQILSAGTTTITAKFENEPGYENASASYTLTVKKAISADEIVEEIKVSDFGNVSGSTYSTYSFTSATTGITYYANLMKNGTAMQFRSSNNNSGLVGSENPNGLVAKEITFTFATNTNNANKTFTIYGNNTAYMVPSNLYADATKGSLIGEGKYSAGNATHTVTPTTDYLYVGFRSANGALYIEGITITYTKPDQSKVTPQLKWSAQEASAVIGEAFEAPTLTIEPAENKTELEALVKYSSSDPEVASIDDKGVVTALAKGTTTITATIEASDKYNGATASYTLTVSQPITADEIVEELKVSDFGNVLVGKYDAHTFTSTTTGITYYANMAKNSTAMQFRSKENSGLVITTNTNDLVVKDISFTFATNTTSGRKFTVYGKNTAYTSPADLYATDDATKGSLIGEGNYSDGATHSFTPTTDYQYVGFRSYDGALYIESITITYTKPDPNKQPAGLEFATTSVSVAADELDKFEAPVLTNPNNLTVTYSSGNESVATVVAETGVVTLTGTKGSATISAAFAGNDSYNRQTVSYVINVTAASVKSIAATKQLAANEKLTVGYELTVAFVHNRNIFVTDAAGDFIQIYGANTYKANDIIPAGWEGTYTLFNNNTPEIMPVGTLPTASGVGTFTPKAVDASMITTDMVNSVVMLKNAVLSVDSPAAKENFDVTIDGATVGLYNNYTLPDVKAGKYDIEVVINTNNAGDLLIYPVSFKPVVVVNINNTPVDGDIINADCEVAELSFDVPEGYEVWYRFTPDAASVSNLAETANEGFIKYEAPVSFEDPGLLEYYTLETASGERSEIKTLKLDGVTGIDSIIADPDAADAVYYNLQGVRVDNPTNGVYVRVQGSKTTKVIVK